MTIQFRNSTKYIKLTEYDTYSASDRSDILQGQRFRQFMKLRNESIRHLPIILNQTERTLNTSVSLSTVFAAEGHRAEGKVAKAEVKI